ncbi:MAG: hypothetical protein UR28_C0005G0005 [Candidatus Peregrinibacteria bacterium GW2011_GWF2_33_10]|nr:MAG: hypothetical protein UR28_C0005G0005 [Candidatus Peregrinibacteria bacterium GW2011_GWF2_33_10]OGJ44111.1 MAG: hypothetical protein A2272_00395 [Candidatus Peregrinibacteria bacterium RIFOXYA12_FULL_33_12]OGJ44390.1 MAG: hypothetical protein A2263_05885 [Candidatus Peregrinibacteria bacterium RIFOXYA2_FULL_33_21]OGJ50185.1 MAG: hypothetical protein A2307_03375 [Candidatus Peregrinibacteria bacterium RIFOXYB2_FULL_33_20]
MSFYIYEVIGFGGTVISAGAHLPQIIKIFKEKDSTGVSSFAWLTWALADLMLLIYSISIKDRVFIFLNGLNLVFASIILLATVWYKLKTKF